MSFSNRQNVGALLPRLGERWFAIITTGRFWASVCFKSTLRRGNARGTDDFLDAARLAGVPVEVVKESGPFDTSAVASLRRIIGRINPDIIQTHAIKSHFLTRWSGLWKERPWVAFHHGY